jgi:imidazolonepropionase-like amidohydrolase
MFRLSVLILAGAAALGAQESPIFIRGGRVFDGTGSPARQADILLRNGRIEAVGSNLRPPDGARIVEAAGQTLIPGLFDLHTHLSASAATGVAGDWGKNVKSYLACGVTTVNDFATYVEMYTPLRRILGSPKFAAPRVNMAVRFSTTGGHGTEGGWGDWMTFEANTPEQAHARMKTALSFKPDVVKVFTDGWRYNTAPNLTSMNLETLSAIVADAHAAHLKVLTHTVTLDGAKVAARAKVDVLVHGIGDAEVDQELIDLLKAGGTSYVSTLAVYETHKLPPPARALEIMDPDVRSVYARRESGAQAAPPARQQRWQNLLMNVRKLHAGGIAIAAGTDAGMTGTFHGYASLNELELLVEAGLTPAQAIVAGTSASARAIGADAERGTIAPGKIADLVLIDGAPDQKIEDIEKTARVFLGGAEVDLKGLLSEIQSPDPTPMPVRVLPAAIDDMERTDGRTQLGTLRVNATDPGIDHSIMLWMPVIRSGKDHAMQVTARLAAKDRPWVRLEVPLTPGGIELGDSSQFTGISFDVRGEGAHRLLVMTGGGKSRAPFQAPVASSGEWQTLRIPFSDLKRAATGDEPWTGRNLRILAFEISGAPESTAWLELDNIRFY